MFGLLGAFNVGTYLYVVLLAVQIVFFVLASMWVYQNLKSKPKFKMTTENKEDK